MTVHIVAGGQYGSEGKGAFTAALVRRLAQQESQSPILVRVAGPNAGHTAYDGQGNKWALRQIPVGAVVDLRAPIVIGQQSEIDLAVLVDEVTRLEAAGIPIINRMVIDAGATIIEGRHRNQETTIQTGTTGKGIGAARAERLLRKAYRYADVVEAAAYYIEDPQNANWLRGAVADTAFVLRMNLYTRSIIIEGTQGYGLGLHTRYYPYTTSSNCRPGDFLAMTGLQPWECPRIVPYLVFRAHPIRIAGESGPMAREVDWGTVGRPVEYTTVTQKPRRVALWDQTLARDAIVAAGGTARVQVAYNFLDYEIPNFHGYTEDKDGLGAAARELNERFTANIVYVGTGPNTGVWRPTKGWSR